MCTGLPHHMLNLSLLLNLNLTLLFLVIGPLPTFFASSPHCSSHNASPPLDRHIFDKR
jgi:hypothetical protein